MMVIRVGINGFGRVGRIVFRTCLQQPNIEIAAINDPAVDIEYICYLIKYDSTHGRLSFDVTHKGNEIRINGKCIRVFHQKQPGDIPWDTAGVQYVVEASGMFTTLEKASGHLTVEDVKRVILTAPSLDIPMLVFGVNDDVITAEMRVLSCGSSTLYCLAPIVKVLMDNFGVEEGFITTIHAMTPSLKPLDGLCLRGKHWREHRSITQNIIPVATDACRALGRVLPAAKGRFAGLALRVPIVDVSLLDISVRLTKNTTLGAIVECIEKASKSTSFKIITKTSEQNVSSDFLGDEHSCILDTTSSLQLKPNFFKLVCWYENEYSYACRVVDAILFSEKQLYQENLTSNSKYVRSTYIEKPDPLVIQTVHAKTVKQEAGDKMYEHITMPTRVPDDPNNKLPTAHFCQPEKLTDFIKVRNRLEKVKKEFNKMMHLTEGLLNASDENKNKVDLSSKYTNNEAFSSCPNSTSYDNKNKLDLSSKYSTNDECSSCPNSTSDNNKNKLDLSSKYSSNEAFSSCSNSKTDIGRVNTKAVETSSNITREKYEVEQHNRTLYKSDDYKTVNRASRVLSKEDVNKLKSYESKLMYSVKEIKNIFESHCCSMQLHSRGSKVRIADMKTRVEHAESIQVLTVDSSRVDKLNILDYSQNVTKEKFGPSESTNVDNIMQNQLEKTKIEYFKQPTLQPKNEYREYEHTSVEVNSKLGDGNIVKDPTVTDTTRSKDFLNPLILIPSQMADSNIIEAEISSSSQMADNNIIAAKISSSSSLGPANNQSLLTLSSIYTLQTFNTELVVKHTDVPRVPTYLETPDGSDGSTKKIQCKSFLHKETRASMKQEQKAFEENIKNLETLDMDATNVNVIANAVNNLPVAETLQNEDSIRINNTICNKSSSNMPHSNNENIELGRSKSPNKIRMCSKNKKKSSSLHSSHHIENQSGISLESATSCKLQISSGKNDISNVSNENKYIALKNSITSTALPLAFKKASVHEFVLKSSVALISEKDIPLDYMEDTPKKHSMPNVSDSEVMKYNENSSESQQSQLRYYNETMLHTSTEETGKGTDLSNNIKTLSLIDEELKKRNIELIHDTDDPFQSQYPKSEMKYLQKDTFNYNMDLTSVTSISSTSQQDIFDKLESPRTSESDDSLDIDAKTSQIINIRDVTKSLEDLERLDKICRIMEMSDELSDKLLSTLDEEVKCSKKPSKWSFKNLCEKIKLEEFCINVFGK